MPVQNASDSVILHITLPKFINVSKVCSKLWTTAIQPSYSQRWVIEDPAVSYVGESFAYAFLCFILKGIEKNSRNMYGVRQPVI